MVYGDIKTSFSELLNMDKFVSVVIFLCMVNLFHGAFIVGRAVGNDSSLRVVGIASLFRIVGELMMNDELFLRNC